jgi:hypothetical protein
MTGTTEAAREIDRVLDGLRGHDLFRKNAFRVTGLALDATPRQVRRAREESRNAYYLPPEAADAPLPPSADPVELRAAFEVLQDPVARLVHELLWAGAAEQGVRANAVRALCRALEGTSERGTVLTETAWKNWRKGLASWADALRSDATWVQVRRRVAEIDDPRVTVALVRTLRQRLQLHVVGVAAGIAAREARTSPGTAGRLVRAVRAAGFDSGDVLQALRSVAQPELDRVARACDVARATDGTRVGLVAARTLLEASAEPLSALLVLLGTEDDLFRGSQDDVALATNNQVVAYANEHAVVGTDSSGLDEVIGLLERAQELATTTRTTELVRKNIAEYRRIQEVIGGLKEAMEAARGMRVPPGYSSGAGSISRPGPMTRQGPFAPARPYVGLGMWGWLLILGPVPVVGIGLGAAALGLPWFWFAAPALIVAFYAAYLIAWGWYVMTDEPHFWLLVVPAGLTWLIATWIGAPAEWLTLVALTVAIFIVTVEEA